MATLSTLQNFIDNIKQTPSGKVEWSDISLKGLEEEVLNLFSTNAFQTAANVVNLQSLSGADSQLVVVENDPTLSKNGIYFWSSTPVVIGYTYPATGGGYWNFVRNPTTSPVTQIIAGTNVTVSPAGGVGAVTINSQSTAINATNWLVPTRLNGTTFVNSNIYDDTNITKTNTCGFNFDYGNKLFKFGDYTVSNNGTGLLIDDTTSKIQTTKTGFALGLIVDYATEKYSLGDPTGANSLTYITVDDIAKNITLNVDTLFDSKIVIDAATTTTSITNKINKIGGTTNRTFLNINDDTKIIQTEYANNPLGLSLSMANRRFTIGDTGSNNGAKLYIDDVAKTTLLVAGNVNNASISLNDSTDTFQVDTANIVLNGTTTNASSTNTFRYLEVTINGTAYRIPLWQ